MFEDSRQYVASYIPAAAKADVKNWLLQGKPVFMRPVAQKENAVCKVCADIGYIYISFGKAGPFQYTPSGRGIIAWFDGGPGLGKGWYIIEKTLAYACPECSGGAKQAKMPVKEPDEPPLYYPLKN